MKFEVLDACAVLAYLGNEPGGELVQTLLSDINVICVAHAVNICEVYYAIMRAADEATAQQALSSLRVAGVLVREDMDEEFWKAVARIKSRGRISIADCFCIALATRLGGRVITSDHHEFDALVPLNLCPILFIR